MLSLISAKYKIPIAVKDKYRLLVLSELAIKEIKKQKWKINKKPILIKSIENVGNVYKNIYEFEIIFNFVQIISKRKINIKLKKPKRVKINLKKLKLHKGKRRCGKKSKTLL